MLQEVKKKPYVFDLLHDTNHTLPDDACVLVNVQTEDVIMDEPERHLSCQLSRRHRDVQKLLLRGGAQAVSGVQSCSSVHIEGGLLEQDGHQSHVNHLIH